MNLFIFTTVKAADKSKRQRYRHIEIQTVE